ncbi:MAG: Rieske (2Fe-2S) protein [Bacteroidales bacterium]|nr:Rieske (2Fe-2S) protein [Bacteroidales bacterium]MCF6341352.1 Rieske (2Fe-2S) protein [Bacteroidales bacterium]
MKENKHNRRLFIKSAGLGLLLVTVFLWDKLVGTDKKLTARHKISIPFNPNKNISFQNDFIVVNQHGQTQVFSSHCTHLGCTINKSQGNLLVCPCHGSAFDRNGQAVRGPATQALKPLPFTINKATDQLTIEV